MTSFGHDEQAAFHHLLTTVPDKPISIVMDAYDLFKAINTLGIHFRDDILKRPETAPVVVRLESPSRTGVRWGRESLISKGRRFGARVACYG